MCIDVLYIRMHACTPVHRMCALCPQKAEEVVGSPGLELKMVESYHAPLGPLEEQPIFLTVEHLCSPCYISLIKGVVRSEFLKR